MNWKQRFTFMGLGLGLAIGQAPFGLSLGYFLILPFLAFATTQAPSPRIGLAIGWWTGLGYFALTLSWIVEPFFVKPEVHGWMAPFALLFMAGGLALFWGMAFYLSVRWFTCAKKRIIGLAILWAFFEYLRATVLTGFPWGHLSYAWLGTPFIQLVSVFGIHGTGLILMLVAFLPALFGPRMFVGAAYGAAVLAVIAGWGVWRMPALDNQGLGETVVRIVQPNAPQHLKWRRDMRDVFYRRQLGYTAAKTARRPDIVIWPETALPFVMQDELPALKEISNATGPETSYISGIVRNQGDAHFNSLIYVDPRGGMNAIYDKHHLVPFGEYFPMARFFERFGLAGLTEQAGSFQGGAGPQLIAGRNVPDFLALICYEAIFPSYAHSPGKRPKWLVHITNDAWFGTISGPYQHLAQSRVRAIEQGLPMARSANTGISAMIDAYGRVVDFLPLQQQGYIDVALPAPAGKTLYSRIGDYGFLGILLLVVLFLGTMRSKTPILRESD
ncbi:apolipoprotein N-acyltransferase [Amylibacter marinus]|uniref:Apolipoprotein N-acyltransferase n=1 Tax=Amylibacter marinus TaxID=1475483 RepID=A0ABQ5VR24_9RHOB|nr:apolipoprotein N-acyltransferase [Amylibacter marinus]GLQ33745.1 apolipoprotein N-acyltransferase [Amylibacter marinus]